MVYDNDATEVTAFSLVPFAAPPGISGVEGTIAWQGDGLVIAFRLTGAMETISFPAPQTTPHRRDGLWLESCCECFVQRAGHDGYHETNVGFTGDWNVYRFVKYRSGMAEENRIDTLQSTAVIAREEATLRCRVPLARCFTGTATLRVGLSCILLHRTGERSYWALSHPGSRPDFHDARAFTIRLEQ